MPLGTNTLYGDVNKILAIMFIYLILLFWLGHKKKEREKQLSLARKRKEERLRALDLASVDHMDGLTFEHYVAWLLQHIGYSEVDVTKGSNDYGADIIAEKGDKKYSIQVKRQSTNVSRRAISDAVGAKEHYGCNAAMVVTNSYFTKSAILFSNTVNCELIDRDILTDWVLEVSKDTDYENRFYLEDNGALDDVDSSIEFYKEQSSRKIILKEMEKIQEVFNGADKFYQESLDKDSIKKSLERIEEEKYKLGDTDTEYEDVTLQRMETYEKIANFHSKHHCSQDRKIDFDEIFYEENSSSQKDSTLIKDCKELQNIDYEGIPTNVVEKIKTSAEIEWRDDCSIQISIIKEQIKDYKKIQIQSFKGVSDEVYSQIKSFAESEYPDDYSMQLYIIDKQIMAYLKLQSLKYKETPQDLAIEMREKAKEISPYNYEIQLYVIQKEIEKYVENSS